MRKDTDIIRKRTRAVVDTGKSGTGRKSESSEGIADFLFNSPLKGSELEIERLKGGIRDIEL